MPSPLPLESRGLSIGANNIGEQGGARMIPLPDNALSHGVIGCAIEVHRHLGPGLVESIYETCLCDELALAGLEFVRQQRIAVIYKGRTLDEHYQMDIVVAGTLVLEIKAVHQVHPIHEAQLRTYLRLSGLPPGLLLNFNSVQTKEGISRVIGPAATVSRTSR
jgi:GxxExxY protein